MQVSEATRCTCLCEMYEKSTPARDRTRDLRIRNPLLYPTELLARILDQGGESYRSMPSSRQEEMGQHQLNILPQTARADIITFLLGG